jgi:nicotinamidase-related amidase
MCNVQSPGGLHIAHCSLAIGSGSWVEADGVRTVNIRTNEGAICYCVEAARAQSGFAGMKKKKNIFHRKDLSMRARNRNQGNQARNSLITPENSALILIDHQSQMLFGVQSHDRTLLINNVVGLAKAAQAFDVPTVLTTVAAKTFSGPLFPEIQELFPDSEPIDRTTMNSWEDKRFLAAVKATRRRKLVVAALWTEVCLAFPVLSALEDGYDVYFVADASGGVSVEAHQLAVQQMMQAGAKPRTWQQVMYEWQRDWARTDTADRVRQIVREHTGAFGQGVLYAKAMFGGEEGRRLPAPRRGIRPVGMGK